VLVFVERSTLATLETVAVVAALLTVVDISMLVTSERLAAVAVVAALAFAFEVVRGTKV